MKHAPAHRPTREEAAVVFGCLAFGLAAWIAFLATWLTAPEMFRRERIIQHSYPAPANVEGNLTVFYVERRP